MKKKLGLLLGCLLLLLLVAAAWIFLAPINKTSQSQFLCIDNDDSVDSVYAKLKPIASATSLKTLQFLAKNSQYANNIITGRYEINKRDGALMLFHHLKSGRQTPVRLTIPIVRTTDKLASALSKKLMMDSTALLKALSDSAVCARYDLDTANIISMFIPNTYEVYWNTSIDNLLDRMKSESDKFWDEDRMTKAAQLGLKPAEVITLASIVDEETTASKEKTRVAGMYLNRLKLKNDDFPEGMPLQADPTIKFAWKMFDLKRIYHKLLTIDSPYNTYRYAGLPPGPIRIPTIETIDAVLNCEHHDYLYMCANPDFSGTHVFAKTYAEHLANAAAYAKALNEQGIK